MAGMKGDGAWMADHHRIIPIIISMMIVTVVMDQGLIRGGDEETVEAVAAVGAGIGVIGDAMIIIRIAVTTAGGGRDQGRGLTAARLVVAR